MKRICLLGAATAAVLILTVASALAATHHPSTKKASTGQTKLTCSANLTLQVSSGATDVTPDDQSGSEAGPTVCAPLGKGFANETYKTADSGDLTGKWQQWFGAGSVYGTFSLTPSDNSLPTDSSSFAAASYTGTFVIKNGTGTLAKATGKGTLKCNSKDSVHFVCKETGKIKLPSAAKK